MKYENVDFGELNIAPFKATHILRPDLLVLSSSLRQYGIISPLVVQRSKNVVIDGNERLLLAQAQKDIRDACGGSCPVAFVDCDDIDAQLMHIALNRGRGSLVAKPVSMVIRSIVRSKKYGKKDMESLLQMKQDEYQLMMDGSLIKHRNIASHKYSRAWVPVEAPAGTLDSGPTIERPPNSDR